MSPSFSDKDLVLTLNFLPLKVNDVIVIKSIDYGRIIKRIINIENNLYQVDSDNNSYNSEVNCKFFNRKEIQGKVFYNLSTKLF
tara:strand:- start:278 stop:529 length:252 start_codon:yes stop_codon:yes gene_type:complete